MPGPEVCAVAMVDDRDLSASGKLAAALERAGFWRILAGIERPPRRLRIVIKPELAGFVVGSPAVTDPALVEDLIDQLHDRGFTNVAVVGAADSSALWAENRDLYALSDLLGYRYATLCERSYEIFDLADDQIEGVFPRESVLHGCSISRTWTDADVRIVFSKNRTDETAGYALCLDTLIGVLPLIDKDLHYRKRRDPGDVVAALLAVAPVGFCLIDAIVSADGAAGRRAPSAIETHTIIAASDIVLADYMGALKMGLDPKVSPMFERALRTHKLPRRYFVEGSLDAYPKWENVPAPLLQVARMRNRDEALDRLVEPWLQKLDTELFPLKHPLDARLNAALAQFFATPGQRWLLSAANALLACIGAAISAYRTLFDKDTLRRRSTALGLDLAAIDDDAFDALIEELLRLKPIAATAAPVSDELRWRYLGEAVVFLYARTLSIDFDCFVRHVDIARTIGFMNDYLGGVVVPLACDAQGRPVRQAERNIYLPQPNYLVLYDGKPIDVSKLEIVEYGTDRQRLFWKTILSENGSATYDDGIATFERADGGTRISIIGRQQFTLPPFLQVFDPDLVPGLKGRLVTHAYQTFFDRTIANFEALVEGRDIRIGRPVDEPSLPPMEQIMPLVRRIGELALPLLRQFANHGQAEDELRQTDADGFVHVTPSQSAAGPDIERLLSEIARFMEGFGRAAALDLAARPLG